MYDVGIVVYHRGVWRELTEYDCIVAYMPSGIVVRGLCPHLKNKWTDPAVVIIDKPLQHAVPVLGGHHGGNEVATNLEEIGMKAVITTSMEYSEGLSVGVGFRKNAGKEEIIKAIMLALREIDADVGDIRVISTVESKKGSVIIEVADELKKPLVFVSGDRINRMDVRESRAVIVGIKSVAEACAVYTSNYGELLLPKRVYGGVTVAIAR
jgi:cobalt-precorrin 5A hydrolase